MTEHALSLAPFYKGWDGYQHHLVTALAPLSAEQLTLGVASHLRSIGMIATHVIGARARWLHYALKVEDEHLPALCNWDRADQPTRSASELVSGLEITWQIIQNMLERLTIADLEEVFHDTDDDGEEETFTRQWVIWHLIEHDLHHGGEISFALGMHGIPAINL
ncbi:DinB family protein [Ktedonosporobacter rubrisoli]|uniref:DinB family protein n=1 Tax=Ktedonosporobacter rubrisoli TaxID=2509675 RepID=A0A4P6JLK6_KTERU|nr:DinB family protein [Ktedonosporobacter rubrisoli]QBD76085.1 DinB family protein [Ktedonosporobacter rubrisoli]